MTAVTSKIKDSMHIVTKEYRDLPAAHRQPNHCGHCQLIHGHNWGFDLVFSSDKMDENGFVVDVGTLGVIKTMLNDMFDHTLLLNQDDPHLKFFQETLGDDDEGVDMFAKIVVVPNCGMEGLAKLIFQKVSELLAEHFAADVRDRSLAVVSVTCLEDSKNSSTYYP